MPPSGRFLFSAFAATITVLGGCNGSDLRALRHWVAGVEARPGVPIPPAPAPKRPRIYAWAGQNLRSPFLPADGQGADGVRPEHGRAQAYLEQFPLDSLRLVGELAVGGRTWALILDPQGRVSRVGVGDRLGRNGGRIVAITPGGIEISQAVPDGAGVPVVLAFARPPGG